MPQTVLKWLLNIDPMLIRLEASEANRHCGRDVIIRRAVTGGTPRLEPHPLE
jgi:hypothetical protein